MVFLFCVISKTKNKQTNEVTCIIHAHVVLNIFVFSEYFLCYQNMHMEKNKNLLIRESKASRFRLTIPQEIRSNGL